MPKIVNLSEKNTKRMETVGYDKGFLVENGNVLCNLARNKGLELLSIKDALTKYRNLKDYYWQLVDKNKDEKTRQVAADTHQGYFIRAEKGSKIEQPVQTCLYITKSGFQQNIHNVIIAEENSEINILTGCLTSAEVKMAVHIGVTEIFVKKGARVNFTMIHNWEKEVEVYPRTAIIVEDGGEFVSNYVCLNPVKYIQMYPKCTLIGDKSVAAFNSFIYATPKSSFDVGAMVDLQGKESRAEIKSKIVCNEGEVITRGKLIGNEKGIRAHMDCGGLIVSARGKIVAIPELEANLADLNMTHEASIGKVSKEAIEYLESRGMSEKQAVSLIIRGFMNIDGVKLPEIVKKELQKFNF